MTRAIVGTFLAALMLSPAACRSEVDAEKADAIRKLMELSGSAEIGRQFGDALSAQLRPAYPQVPDSVWAELMGELDPAEAVELSVPIYDRHFTLAEIQGLVAFYETPLGRQLVKKLPLVTQEAMVAGQQWGQQKAMEMMQGLAERGYEPVSL